MGFGVVVARFGLFLREMAAMQGDPPPPAGLLIVVGVLMAVDFVAAA
jgi:hypothetical protein